MTENTFTLSLTINSIDPIYSFVEDNKAELMDMVDGSTWTVNNHVTVTCHYMSFNDPDLDADEMCATYYYETDCGIVSVIAKIDINYKGDVYVEITDVYANDWLYL